MASLVGLRPTSSLFSIARLRALLYLLHLLLVVPVVSGEASRKDASVLSPARRGRTYRTYRTTRTAANAALHNATTPHRRPAGAFCSPFSVLRSLGRQRRPLVLRALRVLPKTFHAFPSTPPVARLPRVLFSVHCSLFSRAAMPPLRSPGRASAPCTLAKDRAFPSLKSKQPHHPPHHTPSPKPVIGFPILPTPHPSRTVSHPLTSHLNTIG